MEFFGWKLMDNKKWNKCKNFLNSLVDASYFLMAVLFLYVAMNVSVLTTGSIKDYDLKLVPIGDRMLWFAGAIIQAMICYGIWQISTSINRLTDVLEEQKRGR
jgi:hypothetical protein